MRTKGAFRWGSSLQRGSGDDAGALAADSLERCPGCGAGVGGNDEFCPSCGLRLNGTPG